MQFPSCALAHQANPIKPLWSFKLQQDSQKAQIPMHCCNSWYHDNICKATRGRGYCEILPALFGAPNILWSAALLGLIPRQQQQYTTTTCAKTLPHGEWACRDASRVVARGRDALRSHLQRQQDARRDPLPGLWEPLPQPDLASPRAIADSPGASPGRACDPGRSHRTLPMKIW